MQDRELIQMAVFKLQEAARRLANLAREAQSPAIRERLKAVAAELGDQEQRLKRSFERGNTTRADPPRVRARLTGRRRASGE